MIHNDSPLTPYGEALKRAFSEDKSLDELSFKYGYLSGLDTATQWTMQNPKHPQRYKVAMFVNKLKVNVYKLFTKVLDR